MGVAGSGVARSLGAESAPVNPAAVFCNAGSFDLYFFYTKPYNLDIQLEAAAAQFSKKRCAISGFVQHFGNSLYQENQFIVTGALRVIENVVFGINARYASLSIHRYGTAESFIFDLGIIARLHSQVNWGFAMKNANYAVIGQAKEPLPQIVAMGLSVRPISNLLLNADIYKDARFPLDGRFGIEFSPFQIMSLRVGSGTAPSRLCAGFSVNLFNFRIDYAYSSHIDLGGSHLFAISFYK